MNEPTVYSYRYLQRLRWRGRGFLLQAGLFSALVWMVRPLGGTAPGGWLTALAVLPAIPLLHLLLFRFYAYCQNRPAQSSPDRLFSAWWGAGTVHPVPLSFFRGAECTVCIGSLLVSAMLAAWLPPAWGLTMTIAAAVAALPRLVGLALSFRQPAECRVKYEEQSVAFLLTDG